MNSHSTLSLPEILFVKNFFDGVDFAIAKELESVEVAYEEFLTATLGRLLDGRSPFQSILDYPLRALNQDLSECGSGNQVAMEFETHEHAKGFSGSVSHADLGIVFRRENPLLGTTVEKAVLVESTRLYPTRKRYTMRSRYRGFDSDQYEKLKGIARKHDWNGVFYFLYNPPLSAFEDRSMQVIRAIENQSRASLGGYGHFPGFWDPAEVYYIMRKHFGRRMPFRFSLPVLPYSDAEEARE
jgi:hypothetical protein